MIATLLLAGDVFWPGLFTSGVIVVAVDQLRQPHSRFQEACAVASIGMIVTGYFALLVANA